MFRSADGLVSVSPKKLVFSKTPVSRTQCSKLKLKNRDHKTVVVNFFAVRRIFIYVTDL